jgi:jumonji domain-containing protein 2
MFLLQFWKTIKYTPPVYGADLHKSLMSPSAGSWNLADLDSLLKDAAPVLIKGVTYPYCYVGTWKSIFCWHKEDLDLSAINYLHEGHEKYWYGIQPDHQGILEEEAR